MSLIRKRYYTWLFRAYFKRWSKTILTSIAIGVFFFFIVIFILNFYFFPLLHKKVQKIGYAGTYTSSDIPREILQDISYGLTTLNDDGSIEPGASYKWEVKDDGKEYVFYIKKGQNFHNGKELTAHSLDLNFEDVEKRIIDDYTVSLMLKDPYAPFLTSVSAPIFNDGLSGLGDFKVTRVDINAGFVKSIILQNKNASDEKKIINFYPSTLALKTAFSLGEVDQAIGVSNLEIKDSDISSWGNSEIVERTNYGRLIVLFYNNLDETLSNKKVRQTLNYALPSDFKQGGRAYSSIVPHSIYFTEPPNYGISNIEIASNLIEGEEEALSKTYVVSTPEEYIPVAEKIISEWKKIGINAEVKTTTGLHEDFQILIYPINLPNDPDQYTLWHSSQKNNIAKYKSLRIDKLLEDGRSISDTERRQSIYSDFQKYLIDDVPASFLFFPKEYTILRK